MDITVLFKLTYGLYVVGTMDGERPVGCIINTCFQVTNQNPILAISLNKNNYTLDAIKRAGRFSLSILAEDTNPAIISSFGFCSSCDNDKYADSKGEITLHGKSLKDARPDGIDFSTFQLRTVISF